MVHEREDFQDVVKHFFANLSKASNEDYEVRIKDAASDALKCLSFAHCMAEFSHTRVHRKCDLTLIVKDIKMRGLNASELKTGCLANCAGGRLHLIVEVVSAVRLENCFQRDYNYFAPRFSHMGQTDQATHEAKFEGEFVYEDFYVPPGSEDSTYVCLTLGAGPDVIGQVHFPFMTSGWQAVADAHSGIQASPTGEMVFFNAAAKNAHKEPVLCSAIFLCPVASGGRRGSQINRVVEQDKKVKGNLHHSGSLTDSELERRVMMDPNNDLRARGSTLNRLMGESGQGLEDEEDKAIAKMQGEVEVLKALLAKIKGKVGAD